MLTELVVQNLVIVEKARICPGIGLTVISGETGAGKSLLLDALALLMGGGRRPSWSARMAKRRRSARYSASAAGAAARSRRPAAWRLTMAATSCAGASPPQAAARRGSTTCRSRWRRCRPPPACWSRSARSMRRSASATPRASSAMLDAYAGLLPPPPNTAPLHQRCLDCRARARGARERRARQHQGARVPALPGPRVPGPVAARGRAGRTREPHRPALRHRGVARACGAGRRAARRGRALGAARSSPSRRARCPMPPTSAGEAGRACAQAAELVRDAAATCAGAGERLVGDAQELARSRGAARRLVRSDAQAWRRRGGGARRRPGGRGAHRRARGPGCAP
jgi:hypothetical protein